MNKYQRLVIAVAIIDALVIVLFPPFNDTPLSRTALPSFDGFYPLVSHLGRKPLNAELLALQLLFVAANALTAWLVLFSPRDPANPRFNFSRGIVVFALVNFAIILLFPPFEPYSSLTRTQVSTFDSFYFVWGSRVQRPLFIPMLYLECMFVTVNALALWLVFSAVERNQASRERAFAARIDDLDEAAFAALPPAEQQRILDERTERTLAQLGRGPDRRHHQDARYHGPERRGGGDRRLH